MPYPLFQHLVINIDVTIDVTEMLLMLLRSNRRWSVLRDIFLTLANEKYEY